MSGAILARLLGRLARRGAGGERADTQRPGAERASGMETQFLANVSHELRTPLNGVVVATRLLSATDLTPEQQEYVAMARASADLLVGVIGDVLDFSKLEAQKLTLDPIPFSLRALLAESLRVVSTRADAKGLALSCHVVADVPDHLVGDPVRLRQIVLNLVGNALKFTDDGEVEVRVEAEAVEEETMMVHVSVRDTGVGVPTERHAAIFEAFAQAHGSTTRTRGGTGLGLTIASRLLEAMGGRIWMESEVGRGSTFHFSVPLRRQTAAMERAPHGSSMAGVSVLVAEPNANNRRIISEMLHTWRIDVSEAETGTEALRALEEARAAGRPFAAVMVAVDILGLDAFSVIERINATPGLARAAIMIMRSLARRGDRERCRTVGAAAILTRPVSQSELWDALVAALGATSLVDSAERAPDTAPRPLQILLAEDNPINQALAVRTLEGWGHTVTVAADGRAAMQTLAARRFDALIMDMHMPVMDGFAVAAAIRRQEAGTGVHLPIIALTARAMEGDRERCLAAGMDIYLPKPVSASRLFEALERVAGSMGHGTFDAAAFRARLDDNVELERRIVRLFLQSVPAVLERIRAAVAARDAAALVDAAHTLKGAVGNFNVLAPEQAAARLEAMGRNGDLTAAPEALAALDDSIARLTTALEDRLAHEP